MGTATRTKYHSLLFEIKHINMLRSICARSNTDTMFNKINARVQNSVVGNCFLLQSKFITLGKRFHLNNIQNQHFATLWCHAMQSDAFAYNIPVKSENCILCCCYSQSHCIQQMHPKDMQRNLRFESILVSSC